MFNLSIGLYLLFFYIPFNYMFRGVYMIPKFASAVAKISQMVATQWEKKITLKFKRNLKKSTPCMKFHIHVLNLVQKCIRSRFTNVLLGAKP